VRPEECHHPANGLLPWYVKGTLQGTELEWVREHADSCDICAAECDALAASGEPILTPAVKPSRRGRRHLPYALAGALLVPALVGSYCMWLAAAGGTDTVTHRLAPSRYLDLGVGPTRAAEPLKTLVSPGDVGSVVISFVVQPLAQGLYTFDLEGPHGEVLLRQVSIREIDEMGRCTYVFPTGLLGAAGAYAIVVRVTSPDGESRLYPYPFEVRSGDETRSDIAP